MTPTSTIVGPGLESGVMPGMMQMRSIEDPNVPISAAQLAALFSGGSTSSGEIVTPRSSMKIIAVRACVQVIARAIARMPLITYERVDGGRVRATQHSNYKLLKMRPNPDMSSFVFRQTLIANVLLWGNGYAEIVRRGDGTVQETVPIEPERVTPFRTGGEVRYRVVVPGGTVTLLKRDMIHIPGLSFDGLVGLSVIGDAKTTLGASMSRDKFSASFYKNGCRNSGVLEHPGKLGGPAIANLRESFTSLYAGPENAGKPMILEEGMKWATNFIPPEEAQFVETHYAQIEDVCRLFGVPPHKIQHLLRATNNNIEQQSLDFLGDTLAPWVECLEQELNWKLFDETERDIYYAEHLTQAVIQLDTDALVKRYNAMRNLGAINADEIRERENMNRIPDGRGSVYLIPGQMVQAPTPEQANLMTEAAIKKGSNPAPNPPPPTPPGG